MGPRKKSKPSPAEVEEGRQVRQNDDTQAGETQSLDVPVAPSLRGVAASQASQSTPQLVSSKTQDIQKQVENRASWYGSWRGRPAKPVAEVAKDNASSVSLPQSPRVQPSDRRTTGTSSAAPVPPSPRRYMSGSMRKASKGDALPASMSNLSVVSDSAKNVSEQPPPTPAVEEAPKETAPEPPLPPDPPTKDGKSKDDAAAKAQGQQNPNGSWFGWWSRPDGYVEKSAEEQKDKTEEAAQQKPLPESPVEERTQPKLDQTQASTAIAAETAPSQTDTNQSTGPALNVGTQRSSWFWLWSSQQNAQGTEQPPNTHGVKAPSTTSTTTTVDTTKDTPMRDAQTPKDPEPTPAKTDPKPDSKTAQPSAPRKSTGWAFWSREEPEDEQDTSKTHKQVGEIAVEGTPSQNHPEAAQFNESAEQEQASKEITKGKPKSGRGRNVAKDSQQQPATPSKNTPSGSPDRKNPIEPKVAAVAGKSSKDQPKQSPGEPKKEDKNILLPDFNSTYSLLQQPTLWSQIRRLFVADTANLPTPHLHLTPTPPKIKKALAIGIHGFFPSPIYQKILGPPTGTSIRFSNCAASAIKSWGDAHNQPDISIEKIALEGEGLIRERVDTLWKLLLNWIEHIRSADFILVACHSQGVPVSIMLLQKLLHFGCIGPNVRVGVCAMAGISLGPFAEYKTRLFGGTGLELFEFAEPESRVSKMYRGALEEVLGAGVRIVYVGSIDDQLVSLEVCHCPFPEKQENES